MRTGSSLDTRQAGSVACMPTGPSWRAVWTSSSTRTRARRQSVAISIFRYYANRSHDTCPSIDMCDAAPPGRDRAIGASAVRPQPASCRPVTRARIGSMSISISLRAVNRTWRRIGKLACWPIWPWSAATTSHRCRHTNVIVSCWPAPSAIWLPWPTSDWRNIKR